MLVAREHEERAGSASARGYVTAPGCVFLVTLCRFDDKSASGHFQDHLFLVREGWHI